MLTVALLLAPLWALGPLGASVASAAPAAESDAEGDDDAAAAPATDAAAKAPASGAPSAGAATTGSASGGLKLSPPELLPPKSTPAENQPQETGASEATKPPAATTTAATPRPTTPSAPIEPRTQAEADAELELASPQLEPPKLLQKKGVPPFWIDRTYSTHRTRAMALPPLFIHRKGSEGHPEKLFHADLSLTFGWYSKRKERRRWLSPLGLFYGSFSERSTAWGTAALLMGYKRTGEKFNFGQFPLVWWWGNKYVRNLVVLPFHYHQKAPDAYSAMSGLLFWYGHKNLEDDDPQNDLKWFVGAPLFVRAQKGVKRVDLGIPLYVGGEDKLKGKKHRTLFPFFHWQSSEFGNRRELWTPLYVQRRDRARGRQSWSVPPLLSFHRKTRERDLTMATPLVWRSKNHLKDSMTWVAGPWVSYADPDQRISAFAPLFWSFKDRRKGVSTSVLFPLAFTRRSADATAVYTILGGGAKAKDGGWGLTLPPLFTSIRQRPGGKSHQVVTPLFWHFKDPKAADGKGSERWVVPPLAYSSRVGDRRRFGLPALLTFTGREGERAHQVVTPLFWHFKDDKKHTFVVPPFYAQRRADGWAAGLPPLFFSAKTSERRYTVIPPLLFGDVTDVKEQRRLTLSPFFVRSKTPDSRTLGALAIAWDVKRPDERHSALFPLYYRRQRGDRVLTVTPLGGGLKTAEGSTWAVGPVFGKRQGKSRAFGFAPLFVRDVRPAADGEGEAKTTVAFPLYFGRRTPTDDLDMITPLLWRTHVRGDKPRKNLAFVPFYFRQRQPEGVDIDAGLPFFYSRDTRRRTHTLVVGPGFHRLSRTSLNAGVVPIYWWHDDEKTRRLVSLPIIYHKLDKQSGQRSTVALPLWFDFRRPNGSRAWVAFPFAVGNKKKFNFTRIGIGAPGFVDVFRLGKNYRFTGFVPLFFRYQKCGFREEDDPSCTYKLYGSYPLFMYGRDGKGRRTHSALSLYYFDKDEKGTTFFTPLAGARVRPGEELTWYAGIVGRGVTRKHETTAVVPFFFQRKHRTKHKHTTAVVPPLYIGHRDEDSRWFEGGLLFWQFRKPHKVATAVVPPLFYLSESYAERRIHWLLPLYLRDNKMGEDKTFTSVFPLLYFQRRNGEELDVVQFPLIWHIERGENEGTVGAAVWWDIRARGTTTQFIPGVFVRRVNRKGQELGAVIPGLAWWTRDHNEATKAVHWRALLGAIGGGNEAGQRYFSLFGAKIKLKPKDVWEPKSAERRAQRRKRRAERQAIRAGKSKAKATTPKAAPQTAPAPAPAPAKASGAAQPKANATTQPTPKTTTPPNTTTQPGAPSMGAAGALTQPTVGGSTSGGATTQGQGGAATTQGQGATQKPEG
ncbi:MAG: hypothetical protein R3A79_09355 [Nannocystaceae bacterium]